MSRFLRRLLVLIAASLLGALPVPAQAAEQDGSDPLAAARRLAELAGTLEPLPDTGSGITRDVGSIAIIEHDGSNYDRNEADGVPNYAARARVTLRYFQDHGDLYDFLVVFTNFGFETQGSTAFHNLVRNEVAGIGLPLVDNGALFGSAGRLRGYVDMADIARYRTNGLSVQPGEPDFQSTRAILAHEIAHQWLAQVRYRDAGGQDSTALLGKDGAHWSYLLDSDASVMYGSDWVAQEDGSFVARRVMDGYSSLDLYLMGFLGPGQVPQFTLIRNASVDPTLLPIELAQITGSPETVTVEQIIAAEGPRRPDHRFSPKDFRVGFVFLTAPGTDPAAEDLEAVERIRRAFEGHFFALTRGVAIADTTLAETPAPPTAPAPDLEKALAWLLASQSIDGRWEDSTRTAPRDTAAALQALIASGVSGSNLERGVSWAAAHRAANMDFETRLTAALSSSGLGAASRTALLDALRGRQNADAGFGLGPGYASDPLDTALALRALKALGQSADTAVANAIAALADMQSPLGGWPAVRGGEPSTLVTAQAVLALQDWGSLPAAQPALGPGLAALLSRRNPDGGFGESPSTPHATALALDAVARSGGSQDVADGAIAWLQGTQQPEGSWGGSRYETALVLATLKQSTAPNLVVPADSILLEPAPAKEGDIVRVTARVRNVGRRPAGASRAALFDGPPGSGASIAEVSVPALDPGAEASVALDFPTLERAGVRRLYIVADALGEVSESREDDNASSRSLQVTGLLADLVMGPGAVVATPHPALPGEAVEVTVTVRNEGERPAGTSQLRLLEGNPRSGGRLVASATLVGLAPGDTASTVLVWNAPAEPRSVTLTAIADAAYGISESNELNNEASIEVEITEPLPPGPDLAFGAMVLEPAAMVTLPHSGHVRLLIQNRGADPASAAVAVFDGVTELARGSADVGPRASTMVSLPYTVAGSGTRVLRAVADPENLVPETNEANNEASAVLLDPANTVDLEALEAVPDAPERVVGERVSVQATLRNRGTATATAVPVILAHREGTAPVELARGTITLAPGSEGSVELVWTTSFTGDAVALEVVADPFGLLDEVSEANNARAFTLRVTPSALANLRVSGADLSFAPPLPLEGQDAVVSLTVRNPSPVDAGEFTVAFYRGDPDLGGALIGEADLAGLAAGSQAVASVSWSPVDVRGAQGVFAVADSRGELEEYDETDNRAFRPFSVQGLPDIVLSAGDVALDPAFPRAGQEVAVHMRVRNLGGQTSPEAGLDIFEGEGDASSVVGSVTIPALAPQQEAELEFVWTPSEPPGERTLRLLADASDVAREQDEGNNEVRLSVVVQDADLYLTAPYFSPNGDGVRDETALAYRATSSVTVVVSDARGRHVRTLAEVAAPEAAVSWDGRDERGRIVFDGAYTLTLEGEGGVVLGRAVAVVDTNRSALHEAAGTGLVAVGNLTCDLAGGLEGPVFMPSEDAALFIRTSSSPVEPAGLYRVLVSGGDPEPISVDPFYAGVVQFASDAAVSPDGREALVVRSGALTAVDLVSGARRTIATNSWWASWSPDGRWIATRNRVFARDDSQSFTLPASAAWSWSPDGESLAWGNRVVRRDGSDARWLPLPDGVPQDEEEGRLEGDILQTAWRGDGRIYVRVGECGDGCSEIWDLVLDPVEGTATLLPWLANAQDWFSPVYWSQDGGRVLFGREVAGEDGLQPLRLLDAEIEPGPRSVAGWYLGDDLTGACPAQRPVHTLSVRSLLNLTGELAATRLPGNSGILLKGTVSDRHIERFQLEWAVADDPETWHPIGAASALPVIDDQLGVWVPTQPGSYLLRLRVEDRAGNERSRVEVVSWDRFPVLANVTQTERLLSPNGDGVREELRVDYVVIEPTRVEVRIGGPGTSGGVVRLLSLEHPEIGPASFTWDGRDSRGVAVPDGRYTVFVNELPLRVDVDTTPPDIAWSYRDLRVEEGGLTADRRWHAVDAHLKGWAVVPPAPRFEEFGNDPVFVPETDAAGRVVYEDGVPRVNRSDGRAADQVAPDLRVLYFGSRTDGTFSAEDHAGNRSVVPIAPVEEGLFYVATLEESAIRLRFWVQETIRRSTGEPVSVRFQFRSENESVWQQGPGFEMVRDVRWATTPELLSLVPGTQYRGRFTASFEGREFLTEEFSFGERLGEWARLAVEPEPLVPLPGDYQLRVDHEIDELVVAAYVDVTAPRFAQRVPLRAQGRSFVGAVLVPVPGCPKFEAKLVGESGRVYSHNGRNLDLRRVGKGCPQPDAVSYEQAFPFCSAPGGRLSFAALGSSRLSTPIDGTLRIESGTTLLGEFPIHGGVLPNRLELDATALPEGRAALLARFENEDGSQIDLGIDFIGPVDDSDTAVELLDRSKLPLVDNTPALVDVLPSDGAQICVRRDANTGRDVASLSVNITELGERALFGKGEAQFRSVDGEWQPLRWNREPWETSPGVAFPSYASGVASRFEWDVTDLPHGDYVVRLPFCDRSGNRTLVERRLTLLRQPPAFRVKNLTGRVFSPNADGRSDQARIDVETLQAMQLAAEVRQVTAAGVVVVRDLGMVTAAGAGEHSFLWDGRNDLGAVVVDGIYQVVLSGEDACGNASERPVEVIVDTTPPTAALTRPVNAEVVGASVGVRGTATDAHFASYELSFGAGEVPTEWAAFAERSSAVPSSLLTGTGLLAQWASPEAPGAYTLRLTVVDEAGNTSEARVLVEVAAREFLDLFVVSPEIFSPNGDERRDTTTLEYALRASGRVTLEIRTPGGTTERRLVDGLVQDPGSYAVLWDGLTDAGTPAADGEWTASVRVDDPAGGPGVQELTALVIVDRAPPLVQIDEPLGGACVTRAGTVRGTVGDPHLLEYVVAVAPLGGELVELGRGAQDRQDAVLGSFGSLDDGEHVLRVDAEDAAENRTIVDAMFRVDTEPPAARWGFPAPGAVLGKDAAVELRATAGDANLTELVASFGTGEQPAYFVEIARSSQAGQDLALASWVVASLPDGVYTLRLEATDCAGHATESRITVSLDGTAPIANLASPGEGEYLREDRAVTGTASDAHLESWELEVAPGEPESAFQWTPLASGAESVEAGVLADTFLLPPGGIHTLRLTVRDAAGQVSTTLRRVRVDRVPPAAPSGLTAAVEARGDGTGDVLLAWQPNVEPDVDGYHVERDTVAVTPTPIEPASFTDTARVEGRYRYAVYAIDEAGNRSEPATIDVRVDLTPPLADILAPAAGAALSGSVDVRGTAFSPDDFAEYRLYLGARANPTSWTLLKRSTVGVAAGVLGTWTAVGAGPYVLALEAEDTTGNQARVTVAVSVDNQPPEAPVLTSVTVAPQPDALTAAWDASVATDVSGYLVYRNGRLANAPGIVLGNLRGFQVPGPSYLDAALPDGEHCYSVVALDQAGNLSPPSNEICERLDNRTPQATIVAPPNGTRFEFPLHVMAVTPDRDVATVQFQIKPVAETTWSDLGAADTAEPYQTTLDPDGLAFGSYQLRAVATDTGGRTDPAPAPITVTHGDATPPAAVLGLQALVDGDRIELTWNASPEADLAGYHVDRDGVRVTASPLPTPAFTDEAVALGFRSYQVTAVDQDGNASHPALAEALVYELSLDFAFPVVQGPVATLAGGGARAGTTIEIRDALGGVVAQTPVSGDRFDVAGVPLAPGGNRPTARAVDANGNRSLPSQPLLLISNERPGTVVGLDGVATGDDVALSWSAVPDADLFGYAVERDADVLTPAVPQQAASSVTASATWAGQPGFAFDGNPATVWVPGGPAVWTVSFAGPILVEQVGLRFADRWGNAVAVRDYRVEALWEGEYVPLAVVRGNGGSEIEHLWPAAFATSSLRVAIDSSGLVGLAEVTVARRDLVPAGTESFEDPGVADGSHVYAVAAVDRYGAEGAAGTAEVLVGDVEPPAAPSGLSATVIGGDVQLDWDVNPEPDVAGYVLYRDGAQVATTNEPSYLDRRLANGEYSYVVRALDAVGHLSAESEPAFATIAQPLEPPAAPVILFPTDAAHPLVLDADRTDVRGFADAGSFVTLDLNGGSAATTLVQGDPLAFLETAAIPSPEGIDAGFVTVAPDGRRLAAEWEDAGFALHLTLVDAASGATNEIVHPAADAIGYPAFAPDAERLAYVAGGTDSVGEPWQHLFVLELETGAVTAIEEGPESELESAWSPDGQRLAFVSESAAGFRLRVRDLSSGGDVLDFVSDGEPYFLRYAPDGSRLAYLVWLETEDAAQVRILELATGVETLVEEFASGSAPATWSPDAERLVYTAEEAVVYVYDVESGDSVPVSDEGTEGFDGRFDPSGEFLSFAEVRLDAAGADRLALVVADALTGDQVEAATVPFGPDDAPLVHEWLNDGRLALWLDDRVGLFERGRALFEIEDVFLAEGENVLVARSTDPSSELSGPDSEPVTVIVPDGTLPDLELTAADLASYPALPFPGQATVLSARIRNVGPIPVASVNVALNVLSPLGTTLVERQAAVYQLLPGKSVLVSLPWTAGAEGTYLLRASIDPERALPELRRDNNEAALGIFVAPQGGLAAEVSADRVSYAVASPASVSVAVTNGGPAFAGSLRTSVEDGAGRELALLDVRSVDLAYGASQRLTLAWNTGTTYAAEYAFRVRALDEAGQSRADALWAFEIRPEVAAGLRLTAERTRVPEGEAAGFALRVTNNGRNAALEGLVARLRIRAASQAVVFESDLGLPRLLPGALWEGRLEWLESRPAGAYRAEVTILWQGAALALAEAAFEVTALADGVRGTLAVDPLDVLAGDGAEARVTVTNTGPAPLVGYPLSVDVLSGADAVVLSSQALSVDVAAGETVERSVTLASNAIAPGDYPVRLRGGNAPVTLDLARWSIHGPLTAPSIDSPADGATLGTSHPTLCVNNASSPEGDALHYEFQLFTDASLTQSLPGASGVAETPTRTCFTVRVNLGEDRTYFWRARASDGFSSSPWTSVASFTVDARNEPPFAPVPDTPAPGARVASREPLLVVANAQDPDLGTLVYEFRVASDPELQQILTSASGVEEGLGLTEWRVPVSLAENGIFYWSARASDGVNLSPWSEPVSFMVATVNESPSAPVLLRPGADAEVVTLAPELAVGPASDPESDPLTYRFELDREPSFDSPALQRSPELGEAPEIVWVPEPLEDNTLHYWRAAASDGNTSGPWAGGGFFVNLANDAPTTPVPLDPADGQVVTTATPSLRVRNATDVDRDVLSYDFEVTDAAGVVVDSVAGVAEGSLETAWTVSVSLAENATFYWSARASDGELASAWTAPSRFRVNAVDEPPTAPVPIAPPEGASVETRRPTLVVGNALSPDGLGLVYAFELYSVSETGEQTLVASIQGVIEGLDATSWTLPHDLADVAYAWRARAEDLVQPGPWSDTAHFTVALDVPPAPPSGLVALPGDGRVQLQWPASPEPDVVAYGVYRGVAPGGPYDLVAEVGAPGYDDTGLVYGVTVYYVVTARTERLESGFSAEVAATPERPGPIVVEAEVRFRPAVIDGLCLLGSCVSGGHGDDDDDCDDDDDDDDEDDDEPGCGPACDPWLYATVELPAGHDVEAIRLETVRAGGSVGPDPGYRTIVDVDGDGLAELEVRFELVRLREVLHDGGGTLRLTGEGAGIEFHGEGALEVVAIAAELKISPQTIQKKSQGEEILAKLSFERCVRLDDVDVASIRLNGQVPVERVLSCSARTLKLKFDRQAVIDVLPVGNQVEVRLTGRVAGVSFMAVDHVKVKDGKGGKK